MKPIERLLVWLVPVQLVGMILGFDSAFQLFHKSQHLLSSFGTPSTTGIDFQLALMILKFSFFLLAHIILGIWLYRQKHNSPLSRWVWALFGFTDGFWALGVFLLCRLIPSEVILEEQQNQAALENA